MTAARTMFVAVKVKKWLNRASIVKVESIGLPKGLDMR